MVSDRLRAPAHPGSLRPEARLGSEHPACGSPGPPSRSRGGPFLQAYWGPPLPPVTPGALRPRLPPGLVGSSGAGLGSGLEAAGGALSLCSSPHTELQALLPEYAPAPAPAFSGRDQSTCSNI